MSKEPGCDESFKWFGSSMSQADIVDKRSCTLFQPAGECCWHKTPEPLKLKKQQQNTSTHFGPVPATAEQFSGTVAGLSPSLTSVSHTGVTSGETEWPAHKCYLSKLKFNVALRSQRP